MKVYFVTAYCGEDCFSQICKKTVVNLPMSSQTFNKHFIAGMKENKIDIEVLSYPPIAAYPRTKMLIVNDKTLKSRDGVRIIPFINIQLLKQLSLFVATLLLLLKRLILRKDKASDIVLISDYLYLPTCLAVAIMRRLFKTKTIAIVPDIPSLVYKYIEKDARISEFVQKIYLKVVDKIPKTMDGIILFNKVMIDRVQVEERKCLVIEGMYHEKEQDDSIQDIRNIILYTGGLYREYGIIEMIDAMELVLDESVELWICGGGSLAGLIVERAKLSRRVKYLGQISHADSLAMQKQARVLINPRPCKEAFASNSFPSKTFEYLYSGRPVIMSYMNGMPEEYKRFIIKLNDASPIGIANVINETLQRRDDDLTRQGKDAREFVRAKKNPKAQTKKIIDFILNIEKFM